MESSQHEHDLNESEITKTYAARVGNIIFQQWVSTAISVSAEQQLQHAAQAQKPRSHLHVPLKHVTLERHILLARAANNLPEHWRPS